MAPAWHSLGGAYDGSTSALIGEVDCTAQEELCTRFKVEAFPTLKFVQSGDSDMQDYEGEMTVEALMIAAKDLLRPACTPSNRAACDTSQLVQLEAYLQMSPLEQQQSLGEVSAPLQAEEEKLAKLEERLEKLEEKVEAQEEVVDSLKKTVQPKIRLLKAAMGAPVRSAAVEKDET